MDSRVCAGITDKACTGVDPKGRLRPTDCIKKTVGRFLSRGAIKSELHFGELVQQRRRGGSEGGGLRGLWGDHLDLEAVAFKIVMLRRGFLSDTLSLRWGVSGIVQKTAGRERERRSVIVEIWELL